MKKIFISLLLILMVRADAHALSISCLLNTTEEKFNAANIVLTGKVIDVIQVHVKEEPVETTINGVSAVTFPDNYWTAQLKYKFRIEVQELIKGQAKNSLTLSSSSLILNKDVSYLIFIQSTDDEFRINSCLGVTLLKDAEQELINLKKLTQ